VSAKLSLDYTNWVRRRFCDSAKSHYGKTLKPYSGKRDNNRKRLLPKLLDKVTFKGATQGNISLWIIRPCPTLQANIILIEKFSKICPINLLAFRQRQQFSILQFQGYLTYGLTRVQGKQDRNITAPLSYSTNYSPPRARG
jgi:hypothetical protein